jgi:hypothetical protein
MQRLTRANSIKAWALYPYDEFLGSRALKGVTAICVGAFVVLTIGASVANDAAYDRDTAILQKAAQEDGFSLADRARIKDGQAVVGLQLGRCVFDNTIVTINAQGDITRYDISLGGADAYHRNVMGAPHFAQIKNSNDMPEVATLDESGRAVSCVDR